MMKRQLRLGINLFKPKKRKKKFQIHIPVCLIRTGLQFHRLNVEKTSLNLNRKFDSNKNSDRG